jgi:hypothetical protein
MKRITASLKAAFAAMALWSSCVTAAPVSYSFTAHWYAGQLAGTESEGYFTFDPAAVQSGNTVHSLALFTDFSFEMRGFTYTENEVTSALAAFGNDGMLTKVVFGTNCDIQYPFGAPYGTCGAASNDRWNFFLQYDIAHPTYAGTVGDGHVESDPTTFGRFSIATMTVSPRAAELPEPAGLALSLLALAALRVTARRARRPAV